MDHRYEPQLPNIPFRHLSARLKESGTAAMHAHEHGGKENSVYGSAFAGVDYSNRPYTPDSGVQGPLKDGKGSGLGGNAGNWRGGLSAEEFTYTQFYVERLKVGSPL